jgi:predicted RNA-binding protein with PIN domain
VAEPTLYLFDGYNLLHAGAFRDPEQLRDALASWISARGVRGVLVFDGHGRDATYGALEVRYADHADDLVERLAAEHRERDEVVVVSSDVALRGTSGPDVRKVSSQTFLAELVPPAHADRARGDLRDRLDPATLAELERLRRGE